MPAKSKRPLFDQLGMLLTERRNPKTQKIDSMHIIEVLRVINAEDNKVATAVSKEIPAIALAVKLVVRSFKQGGRLLYVGAGTSGRLGVLDAAECPPTFGVNPSMVQGIIAGGRIAVFRSQEGSEDKKRNGALDIKARMVRTKDTVFGIAASMRTPYVIGALVEAKRRGASTVLITTNPKALLDHPEFKLLKKSIDVAICPTVGPEVIMGSTRMKSGTAQKLVLNMITTAAMIQLGKVYENMMVDLKLNNEKLEERAKRVLMIATGIDYLAAARQLLKAGGNVKTAIVMIKGNVSEKQARVGLREAGGFVRDAIKTFSKHRRRY